MWAKQRECVERDQPVSSDEARANTPGSAAGGDRAGEGSPVINFFSPGCKGFKGAHNKHINILYSRPKLNKDKGVKRDSREPGPDPNARGLSPSLKHHVASKHPLDPLFHHPPLVKHALSPVLVQNRSASLQRNCERRSRPSFTVAGKGRRVKSRCSSCLNDGWVSGGFLHIYPGPAPSTPSSSPLR